MAGRSINWYTLLQRSLKFPCKLLKSPVLSSTLEFTYRVLFIYLFIYFYILFFKILLLLLFLLYNIVLVCHTSTYICHGCTHVPHSEPLSLPIPSLWVISVHQPEASCILHRTWTGNLFLLCYYTCFNAILPNHTPHPLPQSPRLFYTSVSPLLSCIQVCSYHLSS